MKLRAAREYFYTNLTEEDLACLLLNDIESPQYPQIISNNECSVEINSETKTNDSPLSFVVKFKASNVSPNAIPNGISGVQLPDRGFVNKKINDQKSHFDSINQNHHDLTLKNEAELNRLIDDIRKVEPHHQSFDLNDVKTYILRTLDDPEWDGFYKSDKKWNKFKNKIIEDSFVKKHCAISKEELNGYLQMSHDGLEEDVAFLKKYNAITDTNKLKVLSQLFSKIY